MSILQLSSGQQSDEVQDPRDDLIESLRGEISGLQQQLQEQRADARRAAVAAARGSQELRRVLTPLYQALRMIFGELDAMGVNEGSGESAMPSKTTKVWQAWKDRLGGSPAKFIDALLTHEEMNAAQLRVAMQCRLQTVYDAASKLNKLGLITKNNGKYSL